MKFFIYTLIFWMPLFSYGQSQAIKHYHLDKDRLAVQGYDLISFFDGKPLKGSEKHEAMVEGARYRFVSAEHLGRFQSNPSAFLPQYGGWCAYAMGKNGEKVTIQPENYRVTDGKLYLFYKNLVYNSVTHWDKDMKNLKQSADTYWRQWIESKK